MSELKFCQVDRLPMLNNISTVALMITFYSFTVAGAVSELYEYLLQSSYIRTDFPFNPVAESTQGPDATAQQNMVSARLCQRSLSIYVLLRFS